MKTWLVSAVTVGTAIVSAAIAVLELVIFMVVLCEMAIRLTRKQTIVALIVGAILIPTIIVIGPGYRLFSVTVQCERPQDVMTIHRVYDQATGTCIQAVPTVLRCKPLNHREETGIKYLRLQWWVTDMFARGVY